MQFIGLDHNHDGSFPTDSHDIDGHHTDSDIGFRVLSLQESNILSDDVRTGGSGLI